MGRFRDTLMGLVFAAALLAPAGCERESSPPATGQATSPEEDEKPALTLVTAESADWSNLDALLLLSDPGVRLSAAVRLVRLADVAPLCVPAELTDATAARLRVVRLADGLWALGVAHRQDDQVLHAPVLIGPDGAVFAVAGGTEEELLTLHVSSDADVFPHLLITPQRVWLAVAPPEPALTLGSADVVAFAWQVQEGYPYVGLRLGGAAGPHEVARYRWDPYELGFMGPAADQLPDPPGGEFALDMAASPMLIPVGGQIPESQPIQPEPPPRIHGYDPRTDT